ncbi:hypothetical protein [Brevundimonas sp.]|uniref:hypothetical protein n=1 Tax=Brevundimonas sp. TaxID=1871086 RepID=UPI002737A3A6|nr:hypothetical protein [Brevundimonas sp.]
MSVPQVPNARPLNASHIETLGPTPVTVSENNTGVGKAWLAQDSSAAGASQGLIGVLVSVAFDAMMNAGPSRRATQAADEIAEAVSVEALNASLVEHFRRQAAVAPAGGVTVSEVKLVQRRTAPITINDNVEVASSYLLSEDATTLQVVFNLSYTNPAVPYVTPYTFEEAPPKSELSGPLYRNTFTWYSRQLPVPVLTPELRERLIASIQDSARDESGALPAEGTDAFKAMTRELEQARDDQLTKAEIAIFLTREWSKDNGALLRAEVEQAHAFIARYALLDMNRTAIPSLTGLDEIVETLPDGRIVRRLGAGVTAGSYVSSPSEVGSFSTYGNSVAVAQVHRARAEAQAAIQ